MKRLLIAILLTQFTFLISPASDTIRILCIGNSFSWDAVEQELAPLCEAGDQAIIIGNLYYGGCSLEQHHRFLKSRVRMSQLSNACNPIVTTLGRFTEISKEL